MGRLNPFSLPLVLLVLAVSIFAAVSDEEPPQPTITRLINPILEEHEYQELLRCKSFGEADYFVFHYVNWALVYIHDPEYYYRIDFPRSYDYIITTARGKYYQESNTLLLAFQRVNWIAFFKFGPNSTETKVTQFELVYGRDIIDFFIWKEIVVLKEGQQGLYFMVDIRSIFESNSSLIQVKHCNIIDSIRPISLKQETLVIAANKIIFLSLEDNTIIVNTLSDNAQYIRSAVYLIKPTNLHPICRNTMEISSRSDGNLISINCAKGLISFIYNVDPFNLIHTIDNRDTEALSKSAENDRFYNGFLGTELLVKEINLSSELFYSVKISKPNNLSQIRISWNQFYRFLEPSHMLSYGTATNRIELNDTATIFAILQNKLKNKFAIFAAAPLNLTHRIFYTNLHKYPEEVLLDHNFIQIENKYCLSNNHSFCFPRSCTLIESPENSLNSSDFANCSEPLQPDVDFCINNHWEVACGTTLLYNVDLTSEYHPAPSRKDQICMELASKTKKRDEYCIHKEFKKSCKKNPKFFISASYEASCMPVITTLSYSGNVSATKVELKNRQDCRFCLDRDFDQDVLIIFDEFEYEVIMGVAGFLSIKTQSRSQNASSSVVKKIPHKTPTRTENSFTFLAPGGYLEVEYSGIRSFKFSMLKMPASNPEMIRQFECLGCLAPRKECYPIENGACLVSNTIDYRAWTPEKGCVWREPKVSGDLTLPQKKPSFLGCPKEVDTNFCSKLRTSNTSLEISLNDEDYTFPLCRRQVSVTNANANTVELQIQIERFEKLFIFVGQKTIEAIDNISNNNYKLVIPAEAQNFSFELVFFTMDPEMTFKTNRLNNQTKIFIKLTDSFFELSMKKIFKILLFALKLFILLALLSNLTVCYVHRRLRTQLDETQVELMNVENPYVKIGYENKHELSIRLSQDEISQLETIGVGVDRRGNKVDKTEAECAMCLEKVELRPHQLYLCGRHYVHIDCFKVWLEKSKEQGGTELCTMRCGTVALGSDETDQTASSSLEPATGSDSSPCFTIDLNLF